ncbi:MAG TPA: APC family permease [Longimicrobium sp.]|nr:APC family permease [Longimicrobium sp.]
MSGSTGVSAMPSARPSTSCEDGPRLHRRLGTLDVTMLLLVAVVNVNLVPVVAGTGRGMALWAAALACFFIPQVVGVLELAARDPAEGGVYVWTRRAFGGAHGLVCGWCYWVNNLFYIPTVILYLVGIVLHAAGGGALEAEPRVMVPAVLAVLWALTGVNVLGFGVSRWLQNAGAAATVLATAAVAALSVAILAHGGGAEPRTSPAAVPGPAFPLFGIACLALVGLELGAVLGGEVRRPRRTIPRAVLMAGAACAAVYLLCTLALTAAVPAQRIGALSGWLQAAAGLATGAGAAALTLPLAALLAVAAAAAACVWMAGAARMPFVMGLDRHLPASLGRTHPRWGTPARALVVQGAASTALVLVSAAGGSVRETYLVLLNATAVIQLVVFLYLFAALLRAPAGPRARTHGFFARPLIYRAAGAVGLAATAAAIVSALLPAAEVQTAWRYEAKLLGATALFLLPALALAAHAAGTRVASASTLLAPPVLEG